MMKEIEIVKEKDWSLNLEDPYYEDKPDEMLVESMTAIRQTKTGFYVNLVTPGKNGDPRNWLIPRLNKQLDAEGVDWKEIRYVDECGCGGHVTRVYR
ncbi:MAG: CGCGG family rSAM-modified RiPP protein [Paenibacillaceae bacterium]